MSRRLAALLVAIVILVNAGASCLFSGAGPVDPAGAGSGMADWNPVLKAVAEMLTLPIPTAGISDVRIVALPVGLGVLAAVLAMAGAGRSPGARRRSARTGEARGEIPADERDENFNRAGPRQRQGGCSHQRRWDAFRPAEAWLTWTGFGVITLALLSMLANGSRELSSGWIVLTSAGIGWAVLIARNFDTTMVHRTLAGLLVLGGLCMMLALAHRADRGLAHFTWPIGPITISGALAAVWSAASGAYAITLLFRKAVWWRVAATLAVSALSAYVLIETGRRAAALGALVALAGVAAAYVWFRFPTRLMRLIAASVVLVTVATAATFVSRQASSAVRETSGPIRLRLAYWRNSGALIRERPLLGAGPNMFVARMTNALAPLRGESPHLYHGNIDPYAHNEWLQAIVELGLPAGLLYTALPIGVILIAMRSAAKSPRPLTASLILALAAGLATIVVTELASITLRSPIMPVWYWTLAGLLAAVAGQSSDHAARPAVALLPNRFGAVLPALVAVLGFLVSGRDMVYAARELGGGYHPRLSVEMTITAKSKAATKALESAIAERSAEKTGRAIALWRELYTDLPGYSGVTAGYAESLLAGGQTDEARRVLANSIEKGLDPYDAAANSLYAGLLTGDAVGQMRCVLRALRTAALNGGLQDILLRCAADPAVQRRLAAELPAARKVVRGHGIAEPGDLSPELLRIAAFLNQTRGQTADALADQRGAAEYYARLEADSHPLRRASDAEWDAFYRLALMLHQADRTNYRQAYEAILKAERLAVLGIRHERVARPEPQIGFLIGEAMPVEFPSRLLALWRLSALLHLMNDDFSYPDIRCGFTLPQEKWTPSEINRAVARMARQAHQELSGLPPEQRPKRYGELPAMAAHFEDAARRAESAQKSPPG